MSTPTLTRNDVIRILAAAKAFHPPLEVGEAMVTAWHAALGQAGVRGLPDCVLAVTDYYASPDYSDPWIKPGHVVARVRNIRATRLQAGPTVAELTRDVDPDDPAWVRILRARTEALASGLPVHEVLAIGAAEVTK